MHMSSENDDESGYEHMLDLLIISHKIASFIIFYKKGVQRKVKFKAHLP